MAGIILPRHGRARHWPSGQLSPSRGYPAGRAAAERELAGDRAGVCEHRAVLTLAVHLHLHFHHHFRGPPFDYGALALAAAASWVGVPGPGEPLLVAAGIFAARHQLDIGTVLVVAWVSAMLGGVCGWVVGLKAGRTVLTAPGPLL